MKRKQRRCRQIFTIPVVVGRVSFTRIIGTIKNIIFSTAKRTIVIIITIIIIIIVKIIIIIIIVTTTSSVAENLFFPTPTRNTTLGTIFHWGTSNRKETK